MIRRILAVALAAASACSSSAPPAETNAKPEVVGARVAGVDAPLVRGDCVEAVKRAVANPHLDVEKVAEPLAMKPPAIDVKKMPKSVPDKNGYYRVEFEVLVDTLGKPDMKTFALVSSSHPWLATSVKTAVAKWTFSPAEVAGCKVPRQYSLGISPRGKKPVPTPTTTKKPPQN
jgi:hypothetical protein